MSRTLQQVSSPRTVHRQRPNLVESPFFSTQPEAKLAPATTSMVPRAAAGPEARPIPATNRAQDSTARNQALEEQVLPFRAGARARRG